LRGDLAKICDLQGNLLDRFLFQVLINLCGQFGAKGNQQSGGFLLASQRSFFLCFRHEDYSSESHFLMIWATFSGFRFAISNTSFRTASRFLAARAASARAKSSAVTSVVMI